MQVAEQVRAGQHERIAWLHDKLSSGARIIPQDVSAQFGVSLATAGRDFDYLQYIAKAPVAFDYGAGGFHYNADSGTLSHGGVVNINDNVYAGHDGNVYKHEDGGWTKVDVPDRPQGGQARQGFDTGNLDRDRHARERGNERLSGGASYGGAVQNRAGGNFDRGGSGFQHGGGAHRPAGGYNRPVGGFRPGLGGGMQPPFPAHNLMHKNNRYGLASLCNLDRLPAKGAILIAAPLKIEKGSGSPLRVLALVESGS